MYAGRATMSATTETLSQLFSDSGFGGALLCLPSETLGRRIVWLDLLQLNTLHYFCYLLLQPVELFAQLPSARHALYHR